MVSGRESAIYCASTFRLYFAAVVTGSLRKVYVTDMRVDNIRMGQRELEHLVIFSFRLPLIEGFDLVRVKNSAVTGIESRLSEILHTHPDRP